ncbi:hypothetical protein ABH976_001680 [Bradyrhizobium ottawaense]
MVVLLSIDPSGRNDHAPGCEALEDVGEGDAVIDHQEEREIRRLLGSLDRQIRRESQATGGERSK